jgi:hypothetical protein
MAKNIIDVNAVKKFFEETATDKTTLEYAINNIKEEYLPNLDEEEARMIKEYRGVAELNLDNFRLDYAAYIVAQKLALKAYSEGKYRIAEELIKGMEGFRNAAEFALKSAAEQKLYADTIEQYGLNAHRLKAHQGLRSKEARWHLLQESMIEESLLKYSMFVIVPFVAYVLLSRIK